MMKARKDMEELTSCINHHYTSVASHLKKAYDAIEVKMIDIFGGKKYVKNKFYLHYSSMNYMQWSWFNEKINMIASSESITNISSKKKSKME